MTYRIPAATSKPAAGPPRAAVAEDVPELVNLRAVMLSSLGRDPDGTDPPWRTHAASWFTRRLARPREWAIRVIGPPGGRLTACGAAWVTEPSAGATSPDRDGYIGFLCTRLAARRRGHGSEVIRSLIAWLGTRDVTRVELHASAEGRRVYRDAGFSDELYLAMHRGGAR